MRKFQKRVVSLVALSAVLLASVTAIQVDSQWSYLSEDHLKLINVPGSQPIFYNKLQQRDYDEIESKLIDTVHNDTETYAKSFEESRLPTYKSNWTEIQEEEISNKLYFRGVSPSRTTPFSSVNDQFTVTADFSGGDISLPLQKISTESGAFVAPLNMNDFPLNYTLTNAGDAIISSDTGIWRVEPSDDTLEQLTPSVYNGKTYEQLAQESTNVFGENRIHWNYSVTANPDGNTLVYLSNKNDPENMGVYVFALDVEKRQEKLISTGTNTDYLFYGWVSSDCLVCRKGDNSKTETILLKTDGQQIPLNLLGPEPYVYAVNDGLIAYASYLGSDTVNICSVGTDGSLKNVFKLELANATTRLRPGNGFSPDNRYFAVICIPTDGSVNRYIKIVDLQNNTTFDIDEFPDSNDSVHEYTWIDNKSIMIILKTVDQNNEKSSWIYNIDEGKVG